MGIRKKFEKAIAEKYPRQLGMFKSKSPYANQANAFLEGAKWMGKLCEEELERAFKECNTLNLLHGAARVRALYKELSQGREG